MHTSERISIDISRAVLWASAFVIMALVIVQAGRIPGRAAHAEMTSTADDIVLLTTDAGRGGDENPDEVLYVIDSRAEVLLVYEVEDARKGQIILRDGGRLERLFSGVR